MTAGAGLGDGICTRNRHLEAEPTCDEMSEALTKTDPVPGVPPGRPAGADRGCTCFQVRRAARLMTQLYDAELAPAGVSVVHYAVLNVVSRDAELTISTLADRLATDRTTLSRTIERMRSAGQIETVPGVDRRERRLRLTPRGEAVFDEARALWRRAEARLVEGLGEERWQLLRKVLGSLEDLAVELAPGEASAG